MKPAGIASPRVLARIAGALYLIIIAGGLFAEMFVREPAFVSGDAAATAQNILAHELRFRLGFAVHLFYLACAVPVAAIFYILFRRVSGGLALLALLFNLVAISVEAVVLLNHFAPLRILEAAALGAIAPEQAQTLAYASFRMFFSGFGVSLVFFGFFCLVTGWLIYRSTFLPRVLGALMALAGAAYLINSFSVFIAPAFGALLFPYILLVPFVAELSLALWLTVKGVDEAKFGAYEA